MLIKIILLFCMSGKEKVIKLINGTVIFISHNVDFRSRRNWSGNYWIYRGNMQDLVMKFLLKVIVVALCLCSVLIILSALTDEEQVKKTAPSSNLAVKDIHFYVNNIIEQPTKELQCRAFFKYYMKYINNSEFDKVYELIEKVDINSPHLVDYCDERRQEYSWMFE
ncbi:hypothetical protein BOO22_13875 [Vibrio cidicii]|nr:hypothetical protein [Vibrio cidicii]